jgi:glyoxylase-like metal-dependent hydrolase (beta-lactamase superfamily II)
MAGLPYGNAYLLADEELVLIDTGRSRRASVFTRAVRNLGYRPFDVRHILITHHHTDHTGGLARLAETTEARIYVHPADAAITRGEADVPGPATTAGVAGKVGSFVQRFQPKRLPHISIGHELQDDEELPLAGGLRVVHTPGHTAGHVSFLWEQHGGVLIVGDAAASMMGRVNPSVGAFTEDHGAMKRSVAKLAELSFEAAVFGHGAPIKRDAAARFRRLAASLQRPF